MQLEHEPDSNFYSAFFKERFAEEIFKPIGKQYDNLSREEMLDCFNQMYDKISEQMAKRYI